MNCGYQNSLKRQNTEFFFYQKPNKIKKSASFQAKNNISRLRVFNEQGIQQNEELQVNHNKSHRDFHEIFSSTQIMLKKPSQTNIFQQQQLNQVIQQHYSVATAQQDSSQQDEKERPKFFNLITQLKMKKIARNFINSLPLRRFKFLKSKQYAMINDKSNENYQDKSTLINIEGNQRKQQCQIFDKLSKSLPIFYPSNRYKLTWDILQQIAIMSFLFCIPIHLALDINLENLININFLNIMLILLSLDIIVNFNTGFFEKGELITSRGRIAQNYLKNMFIIDILSMVPLILHFIIEIMKQQSFLSFSLLLFFFKSRCFAKTFRKAEEAIRMKHVALNVLQLFKLLSTVLFFTHIFASIWILTGKNSKLSQTWIIQYKLEDATWYSIYLKAYYYVTVTMVTVGYGDIVPQNQNEILVSILIMLISCGIFAYTLNQIGVIFQELQSYSRKTQRDLMVLNNYMDSKNISFSLQYQIREYLDYYWKESNQNNNQLEQQILSQLSDNLKQKLLIEANKIILKDSPIFNVNFSDKLLQKTLPLIQEMHCTPEQIIFTQNQIDQHDIYFIEKGKIEVFIPLSQKKSLLILYKTQFNSRSSSSLKKTQLKILGEGESFGERSFFTGTERNLSARSVDFTKLLFIRRNEFIELLKEFPQDHESFSMIKDQISQGCIDKIGMKCYCCENSSKHDFVECPYIHFIPNKYKTIRVQYIQTQLREKFDRFQSKRQALKELNHNRQNIETFIAKNETIIATQNWINYYDAQEYCIEEFTDEEVSNQSFTSDSSSSQSSSYSSNALDDQDNQTLAKQRNSLKSQTTGQADEQDQSPIQIINQIEDQTTTCENQNNAIVDFKGLSEINKKIEELTDKLPGLIKISSNKSSSNKCQSPNQKKTATFNNFQKLKQIKINSNILNLHNKIEGSQEDSPTYKSQKGSMFSQFQRKKRNMILEQNQNIQNQELSVCNSSVNEARNTPKLKKKKSLLIKKNNTASSPSIQSRKKININKKLDKLQNQQKENIHPSVSDNTFVLEKRRNSVFTMQNNNNQQQNEQTTQLNDNQSPQIPYKTVNKLQQHTQFNRQVSIKNQNNTQTPPLRLNSFHVNVYNQDPIISTQGCQEQQNQWTLFDNRIREPIEDFDRQRLYTKYFTKFNYDRIIRSYNIGAMRNIRNMLRVKNQNRRQTLQSGINLFNTQLINSPYSSKQLIQNSSHIFDSALKLKLSNQTSQSNLKKSYDYIENELIDDKINFQQNENSSSQTREPTLSTNLQVPSGISSRYLKVPRNIQNGQFRRKSLVSKSPSFLDFVMKKYSASQDLNQENLIESLSPTPQENSEQLRILASMRRRSQEGDLKSIKSIQENGSHAELDDQVDSCRNILFLNKKIPSIDDLKNQNEKLQPSKSLSSHSSPLSQTSQVSSQRRLSILNQLQNLNENKSKNENEPKLLFSKRENDIDKKELIFQKILFKPKSIEMDSKLFDSNY